MAPNAMDRTFNDDDVINKVTEACRRMSIPELRHFCEGTLRAATIGQAVLREKSVDEFERFNADVESGAIRLYQGKV
jgi:hypothetical protein